MRCRLVNCTFSHRAWKVLSEGSVVYGFMIPNLQLLTLLFEANSCNIYIEYCQIKLGNSYHYFQTVQNYSAQMTLKQEMLLLFFQVIGCLASAISHFLMLFLHSLTEKKSSSWHTIKLGTCFKLGSWIKLVTEKARSSKNCIVWCNDTCIAL